MEDELNKYFRTLRQFSHIFLNRVMDNGNGMKCDMKLSQLKALAAFKDDCPFTMKELAANGMVKLPNMTTMVDSLIREGLAERKRDGRDRRKVMVRLTPEGTSLRAEFMASRRQTARSIFAKLNDEKKDELLESLNRVCAILEETMEKE